MASACTGEEISKQGLAMPLSGLQRSPDNLPPPVCRLPPEILENIFTHGARDYYTETRSGPIFRVPHWVNVSYVCRLWRNVALKCPTLWTYHFILSLRWTEELLARSKQASLKIYLVYGSYRTLHWWSLLADKVLNHAERIQELRLRLPASVLPRKLSLYAPRLEVLDVYCRGEETLSIKYGDILPLRTLMLTACPLSWHLLDLSGVTTLFLCRIPSPSQPKIEESLVALSRMQALTDLHLENALPSALGLLSTGMFNVLPKVSLSCLARLLVLAPLSTIIALLSCMDIPFQTRLRLETELEDGYASVDAYDQIASIVAQIFRQFEDPSLSRSLAIHLSVLGTRLTISASEPGDSPPNPALLYPPRNFSVLFMIMIRMRSWTKLSDNVHIVGNICYSIPSIHVRTLCVYNPPISCDLWRKILGHFDGLRHMELRDGFMPNLVPLLTLPTNGLPEDPREDVTDDSGATQRRTYVPALEELLLYRMKFASSDGSSWNAIPQKSSVLDALSTRKALNFTLIESSELDGLC